MNDETDTPCIRGCLYPPIGDEPAKPKPAKHGQHDDQFQLCNSCFYRMKYALESIPDLMANMRLTMVPLKSGWPDNDRISGGGGGSPAPLRVEALDASDALFSKLLTWIEALSETFGVQAPSIARWMRGADVQGSRPVSPIAAHDLAKQLTSWLLNRLEQISGASSAPAFHDDICWGWDDQPGVFKLKGQYGVEAHQIREANKRECPVCGKIEVFAKAPDALDPEWAVICGRCKWVAEPALYGHYAEMFSA